MVRFRGGHCPEHFCSIRRHDRILSVAEEMLLKFLRHEGVPDRVRIHSAASERSRATKSAP